MIMVDSSVWIDYFQGQENIQTQQLDQCLGQRIIVIGDLILTEVLQGFRQDKDYLKAKDALQSFYCFAILNPSLAIKSAENFRKLKRRGITVRKTADVIIATFCIEQDLPLLFSDRDFQPFVEHLGLVAA